MQCLWSKKESDKVYPYHIYSINDRRLNNKLLFVFKSSTVACRLALQMHNTSGIRNPMRQQVVYMDGMHGRVTGFVTLTMWVYSPVTLGSPQACHYGCRVTELRKYTIVPHKFLTYVEAGIQRTKLHMESPWLYV